MVEYSLEIGEMCLTGLLNCVLHPATYSIIHREESSPIAVLLEKVHNLTKYIDWQLFRLSRLTAPDIELYRRSCVGRWRQAFRSRRKYLTCVGDELYEAKPDV